jgi:hypothetical protein
MARVLMEAPQEMLSRVETKIHLHNVGGGRVSIERTALF